MVRVVKYPYSGLQGPERDLIRVLHEAARGCRRPWDVVTDLTNLGCHALRAQLLGDGSAEADYLAVIAELRAGWFAGDEAGLRAYLELVRRWRTPVPVPVSAPGAEDVA